MTSEIPEPIAFGRAAYEAYANAMPHLGLGPWDEVDGEVQAAMEAAGAAAVEAAVHRAGLEAGQPGYAAYCEASSGKSLVSGEPLPAWEDQAPEIRSAWNHAAFASAGTAIQMLWAAESERDGLREQLALIKDRLENLAAGMELSASTTSPSKKSRIEQECADAVRGIAGQITVEAGRG